MSPPRRPGPWLPQAFHAQACVAWSRRGARNRAAVRAGWNARSMISGLNSGAAASGSAVAMTVTAFFCLEKAFSLLHRV